MKDIKIVAKDFYYSYPVWLIEDRSIKMVKITGQCTNNEVDAILCGLIGFNDILVADTPVESIKLLTSRMIQGEIAFSGGLFFQEDDKIVEPGCCCGLEEWYEIVTDIRAKRKPWMGHDPWGTCLYESDNTIVCSDDMELSRKEEKEVVKITFWKNELNTYFRQLENDMKDFTLGPLKRRIFELAPQLSDDFCKSWEDCFHG